MDKSVKHFFLAQNGVSPCLSFFFKAFCIWVTPIIFSNLVKGSPNPVDIPPEKGLDEVTKGYDP